MARPLSLDELVKAELGYFYDFVPEDEILKTKVRIASEFDHLRRVACSEHLHQVASEVASDC